MKATARSNNNTDKNSNRKGDRMMSRMKTACMTVLVGIVLLGLDGAVQAATTFSGTGNWTAPENWSAGLPDADDVAWLASNASVTVTSNVGTIHTLGTGNGVTMTMNGGTLATDGTAGTDAQNWGSITMGLSNGSTLTGTHHVRFNTSGGTSTVVVDNSTFDWNSNLESWGGGNDTITIRNGGTWDLNAHWLNSTGSTTYNVQGDGNTVRVGNFFLNPGGEALTFNLTLGATGISAITVNSNLYLGGANDTLKVDVTSFHGANAMPIFSYGGSLTGTFDTVTVLDAIAGSFSLGADPFGDPNNLGLWQYYVDYGDGSNDSITLYYNIPEPASLSLLALAGLVVLRRRRR